MARIYPIPAGIALCALVVGLTGVCMAGAWKMLLVFCVGFALSECHLWADYLSVLNVDSARFDAESARFNERFKVSFNMPRIVRWLDSIMRSLLEYMALIAAGWQIGRFAGVSPMPLWACAAWFVGCAIVPWGYRGDNDDRKFRSWLFIAAALLTAGLWLWRGSPELARVADVAFGLLVVNCIRTGIVMRRAK